MDDQFPAYKVIYEERVEDGALPGLGPHDPDNPKFVPPPYVDEDKMRRHILLSPCSLVVARGRGVQMANGTLDLLTEEEGEPFSGFRKDHRNDDRRTPVLWLASGVGQTVVNPVDKRWWDDPNYFRDT